MLSPFSITGVENESSGSESGQKHGQEGDRRGREGENAERREHEAHRRRTCSRSRVRGTETEEEDTDRRHQDARILPYQEQGTVQGMVALCNLYASIHAQRKDLFERDNTM